MQTWATRPSIRTIFPSQSSGELNVGGDYTQTDAGRLQIEISGPAQGTGYDLLSVGGTATLGGTLEVIVDGYSPSLGEEFVFLTADNWIFGELEDWF